MPNESTFDCNHVQDSHIASKYALRPTRSRTLIPSAIFPTWRTQSFLVAFRAGVEFRLRVLKEHTGSTWKSKFGSIAGRQRRTAHQNTATESANILRVAVPMNSPVA